MLASNMEWPHPPLSTNGRLNQTLECPKKVVYGGGENGPVSRDRNSQTKPKRYVSWKLHQFVPVVGTSKFQNQYNKPKISDIFLKKMNKLRAARGKKIKTKKNKQNITHVDKLNIELR